MTLIWLPRAKWRKGEGTGMTIFMKLAGPMALVAGLSALAACGRVQPLRATSDMQPLPPAYGATGSASADALTTMTTQQRPNRGSEPLVRSQQRPDDPFDLPPGQ
jgi:hypothetical protein